MDYFTIYPVHLDLNKKKSKGRKYKKELCLESPSYSEILTVIKSLELDHKPEPTKRHPCTPFVYGRVHVNKMYGKISVINGIINGIKELRMKIKMENENKNLNVNKNDNLNKVDNNESGKKKLVAKKKSKKKKKN